MLMKSMKIESCPEPIKVDPRVRRTRKLIEDAFRALLSERPYEEISVADVTERATIHRGTFYAHFEDKEHLATTMMREDFDAALRTRLEHGMPLTPGKSEWSRGSGFRVFRTSRPWLRRT